LRSIAFCEVADLFSCALIKDIKPPPIWPFFIQEANQAKKVRTTILNELIIANFGNDRVLFFRFIHYLWFARKAGNRLKRVGFLGLPFFIFVGDLELSEKAGLRLPEVLVFEYN